MSSAAAEYDSKVFTCMHVVGLQQPTAAKLPHVAVQSFCQPPFVKLQRPFQFPLPLLPQTQFSFLLVYAPGRLSLYTPRNEGCHFVNLPL